MEARNAAETTSYRPLANRPCARRVTRSKCTGAVSIMALISSARAHDNDGDDLPFATVQILVVNTLREFPHWSLRT